MSRAIKNGLPTVVAITTMFGILVLTFYLNVLTYSGI